MTVLVRIAICDDEKEAVILHGLRIFLGLYLVMTALKLSGDMKKAGVLSACASVFATMLSCLDVRQIYITGTEIIIIMLIIRHLFKAGLRMPIFLTFFYEITVALWEFMISASLGVIFRSEGFLDRNTPEYMAAVWIVRVLMIGIAFLAVKGNGWARRITSVIAVAGLFGVIFLSGQDIITISDEQLTTWIIFSMLTPMAILFFYLNRQYVMEKKIAYLEKEKNVLLLRDYQLLKDTYAANAKMFHDFHNHMDVLYRYLSKGSTAEAVDYIENLRSPMQITAQASWVGDEAVDYLINSKIAIAASRNIRVKTNIEFPRHTNIRSVDLVAVLGNLLDNSLEATEDIEDSLRFINLAIRRINEMLIIKLENGCKAAPDIADGELRTTKSDTGLHGWGLRSVRTTAERYDGTVETEYGNNRFCTVVTLSYEPIRTE